MIDIKDLRKNPQTYKESVRLRGMRVDVDKLLELDAQRTGLIGEVEALRALLNVSGKPTADELARLQKAKKELEELETEFADVDTQYQQILLEVPNLLAPETPEGGEEANRQEKTWGEPVKKDFAAKDHLELAQLREWIDFERGAKVAGSKFYYLKGELVKLERAVTNMVIDMVEAAGFTSLSVPNMVTGRVAAGTGFNPRGEENQVYKIENEELYLIATAEIPLTGYHADEILNSDELPLKYSAHSPAYRMEAGAYGKHSKGLYRVHQFNKVEMYVYCKPEESEAWHKKLLAMEEEICQKLEVPYRVVRIAAGDLGAPAYKKYDIEYWSPVDEEYRELMSCSNCTDFQARRLNIRAGAGKEKYFVHTLNATAIPSTRALIALIENHQQANGTVKLPKALQTYYGGETL